MRQDVSSGEMTGWGSVSRQARRIEKKPEGERGGQRRKGEEE